MIEIIRDPSDRILAVCEYLFCDGNTWQDNGDIVFVGEIFVSSDNRRKGLVMEIIKRLYDKYPEAKKLHFFREHKYPGRSCREYTRQQISKLIGR